MTENVWFVGISLNDYENVTMEEAKKVMAFLGGKVDTDHANGCFDVELPECLDNVMKANGWFSVSFERGDNFYEINAEKP